MISCHWDVAKKTRGRAGAVRGDYGRNSVLAFQITPLCYTNSYLVRGSRPWDISKAAVPKYDFGDIFLFLSVTAWEGRRKKSPVSFLFPSSCSWGNSPSDVEIFPGLPGTDRVCSGSQGSFQPDEMEASLMYGNQSRKRNW